MTTESNTKTNTSVTEYQTENYIILIGPSKSDGSDCYQVVNRSFGIVETETFLLPQALKYMSDLEAGLQAQLDMVK